MSNAPEPVTTVHVHAWAYVLDANGNATLEQTYCRPDGDELPDGWAVYTRRDDPTDEGAFEIDDDDDHDTCDAAMAEALRRAERLGCTIEVY